MQTTPDDKRTTCATELEDWLAPQAKLEPSLEHPSGSRSISVPIGNAAPAVPSSSSPVTGILLIVVASMLLPVMDGIAKHLSSHYPLSEVVWARYFFHLLTILPVVLWRFGPRALWPKRLGVQVLRGVLLLGATALFFAAFSQMPLANTLALFTADKPPMPRLRSGDIMRQRPGQTQSQK